MIGEMFVDANRCIGCRACVAACSECAGHGGESMIHLDATARTESVHTAPTVCMHCVDPACAAACPADAIKVDEHGIVLTAFTERCIGCANCALACPFGVPKIHDEVALMKKCDLCYDRTSVGLKPMCAAVCPSGALYFGTRQEIEAARASRAANLFGLAGVAVQTRNYVMVPSAVDRLRIDLGSTRTASPAELQLEEALW